jgi:prepilin-type processing-associated H-X9-DG protein
MLLPALNQAREKAKAINCKNQLKQMGTTMMFYTDDYNGYFIPFRISSNIYWARTMGEIYGKSFSPYNTESLLFCPSAKPFTSDRYVSYGACYKGPLSWETSTPDPASFGTANSAGTGKPPAKNSQIKKTSQTLLFADQSNSSSVNPMDYGTYMVKNASSYTTRFPFRHGNNANIVFVDGHVKQRNVSALNAWLIRGYTISSIPNHFTDYRNGILEAE